MSNNNEKLVKDIRRRTRKKYSSEEKIRIVLEGMRGEESIAELCRREGLNQNVYYRWSKEFLEAGKQRLAGDIKREASSSEVTGLKKENDQLAYFTAKLPLITRQSCHPFHTKAATHYTAKLPPLRR